jgi:hypothetical protein
MDRAELLKQYRQDYINAGKEQASLESKKEAVLERKQKALEEAKQLGIDPNNIDKAIQEAEQKVDLVIQKMDEIKKRVQNVQSVSSEDVVI